jgi:hypothetical protein
MVDAREILTMWHEGALSKGDALSWLARIASRDGFELTLCHLSPDWKIDLEKWIFHNYDNDVDADDFLIFGDPDPDRAAFRRQVDTLRVWIKAQKSLPDSGMRAPAEILEEWRAGGLARGSMMSELVQIAGEIGPDEVLRELPENLRSQLEQEIFQNFDNDLGPEDFVSIGAPPPEPEVFRRQMTVLREWISKRKR